MRMQILKWFWASPWTCFGMAIGLLSCCTGGSGSRVDHTWEFQGGLARWLLQRTPIGAIAITIGHVILARNQEALEKTRQHERIHVRQYEFWGPFFVPLYFLLSALVWARGGKAYRDNPFEVEAFACDNPDAINSTASDQAAVDFS